MSSFATQFPISTERLQAMLPHRGPMVWIDHVLSAADGNGVSEVTIHSTHLACDSEGLKRASMIEFLAQSAGYAQAASSQVHAKKAYLAAVNHLEFGADALWDQLNQKLLAGAAVKLTIKTSLTRAMGKLSVFTGQVFFEDQLLAQGTFKTFAEV